MFHQYYFPRFTIKLITNVNDSFSFSQRYFDTRHQTVIHERWKLTVCQSLFLIWYLRTIRATSDKKCDLMFSFRAIRYQSLRRDTDRWNGTVGSEMRLLLPMQKVVVLKAERPRETARQVERRKENSSRKQFSNWIRRPCSSSLSHLFNSWRSTFRTRTPLVYLAPTFWPTHPRRQPHPRCFPLILSSFATAPRK